MHRLLLVGMAAILWGALPPLSKGDRAKDADVVVLAEVVQIYDREERLDATASNTRFLLEVRVKTWEKGGRADAPTLLYLRTWQPAKRPAGWVGAQGQNVVPGPGDVVRLFARRSKDGGLDLLGPNGVERVESAGP